MLKITIIGNNLDAANFIKDCEIVDDINKADIIVISGNINYRSATIKFNKITKDKLVIGLGKSGSEFIAKRLGFAFVRANIGRSHLNSTLPVFVSNTQRLYEAVPEFENVIIPNNTAYRIIGSINNGYCSFGRMLTDDEVSFVRSFQCPVISLYKTNDKPYYLCIELNPKYIVETSIKEILNFVICEYTHLL